jgi:hypothetical protein
MNKVFPFAKFAGICFPMIMVFQIVISILRKSNPIISVSSSFLVNAIWIIFFILLIRASAKHSPVVPPSWIAIVAFVCSFASSCLSSYFTTLYLNDSEDWDFLSKLITASNVMHYIYAVALVVAFIWLSRFFPKGSISKAMCITIAVVTIVIQISNLTIHPWKIEDESTRNLVQMGLSILWTLALYIPPTIFFLAFSKLKK